MTNEEIFKYAVVKLGRNWSSWAGIYTAITVLGMVGLVLIASPVFIDMGEHSDYQFIVPVILTLIGFIGWALAFNYAVEHRARFKRNFTYNLVRKDERNRCMTKMERYEHEGSK